MPSPIAPFGGNPAAVCLLDAPADPAWMQRVAAEMNLAETAFLVPQGERIRAALVHADRRGRAVRPRDAGLGPCAVADRAACRPAARIAFETASGVLTAEPDGDRIAIELPARPMAVCATPEGLVDGARRGAAVGVRERAGQRARQPGRGVLDESEVRALAPRFDRLRRHSTSA